ncbi:hypothetical protein P9209_00735 [Prescottella defluvii]|nr:hypothetical protein P9209_00735 [Prescottella defluvii]
MSLRVVGRALTAIPAGAGAAAMSAGIVSVALQLADVEWFSLIWLVVGGLIWIVLVAVFAGRLLGDRVRWVNEANAPQALTGVAATCVLGARCVLLDWNPVGWAALGAVLVVSAPAHWLTVPAFVAFLLGLFFYLVVFVRFSYNQFRVGAGDQWVFAGGLAISAVAAGKLAPATEAAGWSEGVHHAIQVAGTVIVCLAMTGYAILVVSEIRWPRLHYDVRRWSTAFPMGMTSAASLTVATSSDAAWLRPVGLVLVWPAVVVCVVLLVGSGRNLVRAASA